MWIKNNIANRLGCVISVFWLVCFPFIAKAQLSVDSISYLVEKKVKVTKAKALGDTLY